MSGAEWEKALKRFKQDRSKRIEELSEKSDTDKERQLSKRVRERYAARRLYYRP